ncbi:class I SAM-dependent methyltransferase [Persicimonas caeni]|uniref:Class I SAM-dependent methyltransferase n=1 Tax=Persicimonas caeni TaxID=2292766 RepID=A0A4Y6PWK5_PERCE|nr:class I SAM-dependent methyltransferase [Persicimonas caeni]QDG52708.1 class I SAM-dependent methyltransferase [Persicimonas caeni]QED33930.1 class I SAM-dependent methyltransferase [Persicimonas caeni]
MSQDQTAQSTGAHSANADTVPTGNTYDKYGSSNPVVRWMMREFKSSVWELLDYAGPEKLLDVGCGEGIMARAIVERYPSVEVTGIDLEDDELEAHWKGLEGDRLSFCTGVAESLPFDDDAFDTITSLEVLEHVQDPHASLAEMARVARRKLVLSVPREPLWRVLNMARGAYLRDLGNTPGHLNHWSRTGFVDFAAQYGRVIEVRSPLPWTVVLVDVTKL